MKCVIISPPIKNRKKPKLKRKSYKKTILTFVEWFTIVANKNGSESHLVSPETLPQGEVL